MKVEACMRRGLASLVAGMFLVAPVSGRAQDKKEETQPSQRAATPEPAKPAPAAAPTVTVYGTFNVNTQWTRSVNATVGVPGGATSALVTAAGRNISPRLAVSTDSTNFGVRAALPFSPWAKAIAQCETSANVDGIAASGICNRNSQLGVSGGFGTLFFGNWDTPFKSVWYGTKVDDPFGNTDVFDRAGLMGSPGYNVKSSAWKAATGDVISGFNLRAQNSVAYWTPSFSGLSAKFQYGTNEFKNTVGDVSPKLWSANVVYDRGPFSLVGAYESHEWGYGLVGFNAAATGTTAPQNAATRTFGATAVNTAAAHTEDYAWRVGAGYELKTAFGATTPNFVFEQVKFMQPRAVAGAIKEYDHYAWSASLKHRAGNHELRGRYDRANAGGCKLSGPGACSTKDTGSDMITAGYAFYFAPTAQVYLTWTQIRNDRLAQYSFATAGAAAIAGGGSAANTRGTVLPGQDPQALALGMRYAF
jgi:predicted porin